MGYYVLDIQTLDAVWTNTITMLIVIVSTMISIWYTKQYTYVTKNWDQLKCQPEYTAFAFLYGKSTGKTLDSCYRDADNQSSVIQKSLAPVQYDIEKNRRQLSSTERKVFDLSGELQKMNEELENPKRTENAKNLAKSIQNNIEAAKESLRKILTAVIVQSNIQNGIIRSTKSL